MLSAAMVRVGPIKRHAMLPHEARRAKWLRRNITPDVHATICNVLRLMREDKTRTTIWL